MMNQTVLVGRVKEIKKEKNSLTMIIGINRNYKNADGIYEIDYIPCIVWAGIAQNVESYCNVGDVVGINGKLETIENEIKVVAERVSFLSSKKEEGE